jgi:hypothetical protein
MRPRTFRKKPVEIEAVQIDGTEASAQEAVTWAEGSWVESRGSGRGPDDPNYVVMIRTLEGVMRADPGDWIIKEPFPTADRKFYPCKADIFDSTYEEVE